MFKINLIYQATVTQLLFKLRGIIPLLGRSFGSNTDEVSRCQAKLDEPTDLMTLPFCVTGDEKGVARVSFFINIINCVNILL